MNPDAYSPSVSHFAALDATPPSLRFDGPDFNQWKVKLLPKLRSLLGMGRMPTERVPLNTQTLWTRDHPLGKIQKIVFTSEPGADVPAYLCLPKTVSPPYICFICLQGHNTGIHFSIGVDREDETTPIPVEGEQDFGIGCMKRGIAALCIEQRGLGEREERSLRRVGNPCHDPMWRAELLGRTIAGERVYDVDRAIDYLAERGDVDMERVGVMGNSGGGMVTICAAGLLPRVGYAMPASHFCTYREGLMSIHHCGCCFIPGILAHAEMADVLGLFAPRPVVVVAGREDPSKPIRAVRQAFWDLQTIYRAAGAEDRCHLVVGNGGHRFYARQAWDQMCAEISR